MDNGWNKLTIAFVREIGYNFYDNHITWEIIVCGREMVNFLSFWLSFPSN